MAASTMLCSTGATTSSGRASMETSGASAGGSAGGFIGARRTVGRAGRWKRGRRSVALAPSVALALVVFGVSGSALSTLGASAALVVSGIASLRVRFCTFPITLRVAKWQTRKHQGELRGGRILRIAIQRGRVLTTRFRNADISTAIGLRLGMAIRTKETQVLCAIVIRTPIDVVNLKNNRGFEPLV